MGCSSWRASSGRPPARRRSTTRGPRSTSFPRASTAAAAAGGADTQAMMYDGLTPLFDQVTNANLHHLLQVGALRGRHRRARDAGGRPEPRASTSCATSSTSRTCTPRPTTAGSGRPAGSPPRIAGCCSQQARYNARVAAIDAPGLSALDLISASESFTPERPDRERGREADPGAAERRPRGRAPCSRHRHLHLGDQRLPRPEQPLDRAVDAQRRLRAERPQGPVPRPGRRRRGPPLAVPRRACSSGSGASKGKSVFNDLRQFKNPDSPTSRRRQLQLRPDPGASRRAT